MTQEVYLDINRRHDFVLLFDVTDGNPNGDPDMGNMPRLDPETNQGLVTDVCIKRKVRDFVDMVRGTESRYKIYVRGDIVLETQRTRAYESLGIKSTGTKQDREDTDRTRAWMCENFWDVRTFGAVMTLKHNCGQVRGPLQLTFARSVDMIVPMAVTITRVAVSSEEEMKVTVSESGKVGGGKDTEIGSKMIVPYGLYRAHGFFNPYFAQQTGFDSEDLALFWKALQDCWDLDRSATRGMMACRGLYVFSHDSPLGNAHAHELFDRVSIQLRDGVEVPRMFSHYTVAVTEDLPAGITLTHLVG